MLYWICQPAFSIFNTHSLWGEAKFNTIYKVNLNKETFNLKHLLHTWESFNLSLIWQNGVNGAYTQGRVHKWNKKFLCSIVSPTRRGCKKNGLFRTLNMWGKKASSHRRHGYSSLEISRKHLFKGREMLHQCDVVI